MLINELYKIQFRAFKKHRITKKMTEQVLFDSNIEFRCHTTSLLKKLKQYNMPMYIISGGVSDMIASLIVSLFVNEPESECL